MARPAAATSLSGAVSYSANPDGSFYVFEYTNTYGGDPVWNLYVAQPNTGMAGPLMNSGDGATTRINYNLTPGTYTFYTFNEPGMIGVGNPTGYFGLNLYFNGNDAAPGISVYAPTDVGPSPPYPAYSVDSSANSMTLEIGSAPAAGTLSYTDGSTVVTLTDYHYSLAAINAVDRVSQTGSAPNGRNDNVGMFTLVVTAVPEPSTLALASLGILLLLRRRRRAIPRPIAGH